MKKIPTALLLLNLLFTSYLQAQNYIINTIAGNGSFNWSGDGGPALNAGLNPQGLAIDTSGNIYIGDWYNNRVRKIDTKGVITTIAGNGTAGYSGDGGPATNAELNQPTGVAVDDSGNVFIADTKNNRIRRINPKGIISTFVGNGTGGYAGDGGPATAAEINIPEGIKLDTSNNLYIADLYNSRIRKVAKNIITTIAGNGTAAYGGDGGPATAAQINWPLDIALDHVGNIYIDDADNYCIRKVDSKGTITTYAGTTAYGYSGDGGSATAAKLSWPTSVATDTAGNLFIVDAENQRVRKVDKGDTITTIAGNGIMGYSGDGGPATVAEIDSSWAIIVDKSNTIYFGDKQTHVRILTLAPAGINDLSGPVSQISLYPNPAFQTIYLSFTGFKEPSAIIELTDITGRILQHKKCNISTNKALSIYVGDLASGTYFATIISPEKPSQTLKFVKQ